MDGTEKLSADKLFMLPLLNLMFLFLPSILFMDTTKPQIKEFIHSKTASHRCGFLIVTVVDEFCFCCQYPNALPNDS